VIAVKHRNEERRKEREGPDGQTKKAAPKAKAKGKVEDLLPPESYGLWKFQRKAAVLYLNLKVQVFVACLIAGNFLANILEEWIDPAGTEYELVWKLLDNSFNVLFFFELTLNMYGFWFWRFWRSAWNVFDFVVVSVGLLGLFEVPLPGPLGMLRMLRAFRVFRLFKRVKSLNKIMVSLASAVPGVINAFLIVVIIMAIYAILGVEFFMEYGDEGFFINEMGDQVPLTTGRAMNYGEEYFGNFGLAMYTMFQVLTGESWSEVVARPLLFSDDSVQTLGVAVYFASFNVLVGIVLINVVVAVLLEKMVDDSPEEAAATSEEGQEQSLKAENAKTEAAPELEPSHAKTGPNGDDTRHGVKSNADLPTVQLGMEALRYELATVKNQIRMITETFQTMEPVYLYTKTDMHLSLN